MSEVKLYSRDEWDESSSMFVSIPATNAEIKAAHPKCATCEYWKAAEYWKPGDRVLSECRITEEEHMQDWYCADHTPKAEGDEGAQG